MLKIYKSISTIKAKEATGNKPTHYLKAQINKDDKEGVLVASLWAKSGEKDGVKYNFLSGVMKDKFVDQDGNIPPREGYVIVSESELNGLLTALREMKAKLGEPADDYPINDGEPAPF